MLRRPSLVCLVSFSVLFCFFSLLEASADAILLVGIIAAIVWFPFGIGLCILDRTVTCKRCGAVVKARPSIHIGGRGRN